MRLDPLRHHRANEHLNGAFGSDLFGKLAERFARFFGTPKFIIGQTIFVMLWILANAWFLTHPLDPMPFILLNLGFSTQAAYAAPLILLAQSRQADRDKAQSEADAKHREELATYQAQLLTENTNITKEVQANTSQIEELHKHVTALCNKMGVVAGDYNPSKEISSPPPKKQ